MLAAVRRLLRLAPGVRSPPLEAHDAFAFFSSLDQFQRDAFRRLRRCYPEPGLESFCKLAALKAANAFAADYHFRHRHSTLVSRPMQLQIDPTNACRLQCPSCLHTANADWASRFDWPSATLAVRDFDRFCREFGPFATGIALFRDGEPLLHRRFPEFVALAKGHLLYTLTSTCLSTPLDAEALVASGLDRLVAAVDGATAATYGRYRRRGDFDLVIDNLRAIVRARKAQSVRKPWLVWQFLAFEHNVHEVELAETLARRIGIDELVIARPHSVEHDDPDIKVAEAVPFGQTLFAQPYSWCTPDERTAVSRNAEQIDRIFTQSWADRYRALDGAGEAATSGSACRWLYYSLTMDAAQRITPCCLPPMGPPEPRHLVYAQFNGGNVNEVVNSSDAAHARRRCRTGRAPDPHSPYCLTCTDDPRPPLSPDASQYVLSVDERKALPESIRAALAASPLFTWPLRQQPY